MPAGVLNFLHGRRRRRSATRSSSIRRRASSPSPARAKSACGINEKAGARRPGQIWIKRAILEMGGKDVIVVDETADLEDAADRDRRRGLRLPGAEVLGLLAPDRPREGPRGPARARRREDEGAHRRRRARPEEHRRRRDQRARAQEDPRVHRPREEGRPRGRGREGGAEAGLLRHADGRRRRSARRAPGAARRSSGRCSRSSRCATSRKASRVANNSEYGLTGALYSRVRERLERGKREFHVGQPLPEPQVHGRPRRRAPLRRLQHVGNGLEGRRPRLPLSLHPAEGDLGEAVKEGRMYSILGLVRPRSRRHRDRLDPEERRRHRDQDPLVPPRHPPSRHRHGPLLPDGSRPEGRDLTRARR